MAIFHFRLKSDKKPGGAKVSPVKHVEYINREGSFAHDERWKETNKFSDNFISTAQTPNALNGINALLYKTDDFGSIKNTQRGLPLIINGSPDFHNDRKKFIASGVTISYTQGGN